MSQSRGAAASTSGSQDHIAVNQHALDQVVGEVRAHAEAWATTTPVQRADLLARIVRDTFAVA
jgi:hypothetical protein